MKHLPLLATLLLLGSCDTRSNSEVRAEALKAAEATEHNKGLDAFYEQAWVDCVNSLSIDKCKVIQETGFYRCRDHRTFSGEGAGIVACADERFKERKKLLFPTSTDKLPGNITEAEEPLPGTPKKK